MEQVSIATTNDADARRITAVLGALGYEVTREDRPPLSASGAVAQRVEDLARRHTLSERETTILSMVVCEGLPSSQIAEVLEISRATVKWHMHNLFFKTGTSTREGLLRLTLTA